MFAAITTTLDIYSKIDEDNRDVNENYATRIDSDAEKENCVNEALVSAVGTSKQLKGEYEWSPNAVFLFDLTNITRIYSVPQWNWNRMDTIGLIVYRLLKLEKKTIVL